VGPTMTEYTPRKRRRMFSPRVYMYNEASGGWGRGFHEEDNDARRVGRAEEAKLAEQTQGAPRKRNATHLCMGREGLMRWTGIKGVRSLCFRDGGSCETVSEL
jgi:hypothetical protein